jgi:hypothetical protein
MPTSLESGDGGRESSSDGGWTAGEGLIARQLVNYAVASHVCCSKGWAKGLCRDMDGMYRNWVIFHDFGEEQINK